MSGVTDEAFRLMFLKYGKPDVFWTEFISAAALVSPKGRKYCLNVLKFKKPAKSQKAFRRARQNAQSAFVGERPIVAQIFGSNPVEIEKACQVVADLGFDGIDINMGCPDKDIEKQGAGSALIKNPDLAKEIIRAAKRGAKNLPISVKTRLGYAKNEIKTWIPALLEENISALTIHFRTRNEFYLSPAHWELAEEIVNLKNEISPKTIIIGNGDVKTLEQAHKLVKETGVDGVMIGRAVLGNPWFFTDHLPTTKERLKAVIEHAKLYDKFGGPFDAVKKHLHAYVKSFEGARELREKLMATKSLLDVKMWYKEL